MRNLDDWTDDEVRACTGFRKSVLEAMWLKYSLTLPTNFWLGWQCSCSFQTWFDMYIYMHLYGTYRQTPLFLHRSRHYVDEAILPCMNWAAKTYHEIYWEDRLSPWNHAIYFPRYATGNMF
jgi:hypothetical protein